MSADTVVLGVIVGIEVCRVVRLVARRVIRWRIEVDGRSARERREADAAAQAERARLDAVGQVLRLRLQRLAAHARVVEEVA